MRDRIVKGVLVLAMCLPSLAAAQQPTLAGRPVARRVAAGPQRQGSLEISLGLDGTYLAQSPVDILRRTDSTAGRAAIGGVIGAAYHLGRSWSLGGGLGIAYTKPATVFQLSASVNWTPDVNARTSPFLTLGFGVTSIKWSSTGPTGGNWSLTGKYGFHLGAGIVQTLSRHWALRVELREQLEHDDSLKSGQMLNSIGSVGLSWFIGGRAGQRVRPPILARGPVRAPAPVQPAPVQPQAPKPAVRPAVTPTPTVTAPAPSTAARLAIAPGSVTLSALRASQDLTLRATDAHDNPVASPTVTWSSSAPTVVAVFPTGRVVSLANGRAIVTATAAGGQTASASVTVAQEPATVTVLPATLTLTGGGTTVEFAARAADATGHPVPETTFQWSSDAPAVATVSPAGIAKAVGNGTAHITASVRGSRGVSTLTVVGAAAPVAAAPVAAAPAAAPAAGPAYSLPAPGRTILVRGLTFHRATTPTAAGAALLDRIAAAMRSTPGARWEISSYWDNGIPPARAQDLTQRRADAVRDYLISHGAPGGSLTAVGYGSADSLASNATVRGRALNRRVEIKRLP